MIHTFVTRHQGRHSMVHAEPGRLNLSLSSDLSRDNLETLLGLVDEISADLTKHSWTGKLTFNKDEVKIELNSGEEQNTWTRVLPIDNEN